MYLPIKIFSFHLIYNKIQVNLKHFFSILYRTRIIDQSLDYPIKHTINPLLAISTRAILFTKIVSINKWRPLLVFSSPHKQLKALAVSNQPVERPYYPMSAIRKRVSMTSKVVNIDEVWSVLFFQAFASTKSNKHLQWKTLKPSFTKLICIIVKAHPLKLTH